MSRHHPPFHGRITGCAVAVLLALGVTCAFTEVSVMFTAASATDAAAVAPSTTTVPRPAAPVHRPSVAPRRISPAPTTAPASPPAPPKPLPVATVAGQEAIVSIPSLGIELPVVEGGQAVIDEGIVAHYEGPGWLPPVAAGAAGTYWLAAHHSTHGDPFGRLPSVQAGAHVTVTTMSGHAFTYTVIGTQVTGVVVPYTVVYGTDPGRPRILLQTCLGATERLLVHGVLTSAS